MLPTTIATWLARTQALYRQANRADEATAECRLMLAKHLNLPYATVLLNTEHVIKDSATLDNWVQQRLGPPLMPLAYVLGEAWFMGHPFYLTPDVLIPRPETEVLADWAVTWIHTLNPLASVCDIGTGSGILACTIARHCPQATVNATDICPRALAVAQNNAQGLAIRFYQGEGLHALPMNVSDRPDHFDLILSNPPYIPDADWSTLSQEVQQEPRLALTSGPDGLGVLRHLLTHGQSRLKPGALMALEIEYRQWSELARHAQVLNWQVLPPLHDLEGQQRFLLLQKPF
jgi:release factor glutamine methyltransferase